MKTVRVTQYHRGTIEQTDDYEISDDLLADYEAAVENGDEEMWLLDHGTLTGNSSMDVHDLSETIEVYVEEVG